MKAGRISETLKHFLSAKSTVTVLFILAIICRMENALFNQDFNSDKEAQIIAAQSFIEGKGIKLPIADTTDISKIAYESYTQWPKGYSLYFGCIYYVVRNVYWAAFILDAIAILIYLFSWRQLIRIFSPGRINRNYVFSIFLILTAFSNVPFFYLKSSDLVAVSFYLAALSCLFSETAGGRAQLKYVVGLIFLCLAIYERYAYIPVAFAILSGFLLLYYKNRRKYFIARFFIGLVVIGVFVGLTNQSSNSSAFENKAISTGYQFSTLSKFYFMFPVQTIMAGNTVHSISKILRKEQLVKAFLVVFTLFITVIFIWALWKLIFRFIGGKLETESAVILISSFMAGGISILLLVYMSLTRAIQKNDVLDNWTYVQEERYYVIMWITILMSFMLIILYDNGFLKRIILFILFAAILIEVPYFIYNKYIQISKNSSYFVTGEKKIYFMQFPKDVEEQNQVVMGYDKLESIIDNSKQAGIKPVYLSADRSERIAAIMGASFGPHQILKTNIYSGKKQVVIIKLSKDDPYFNGDLQAFVKSNQLRTCYIGSIGTIYTCTITGNMIGEYSLGK